MITKNNDNVNVHTKLDEENFKEHKLMANDLILKLNRCGFEKQSTTTCSCGSYLLFSHQQNINTDEYRKRLKQANFCKFRFCPTCNWRRSRNLGRSLLQAFEEIKQTRDIDFIFLTLTIKNPPINELKQSVKHMNESFKRMSKTKAYKQAILGHFKALEILGDKTKDGEAHPHFHIMLIVSKSYFTSRYYIKHDEWQQMWKKALRIDYTPSVDVRKLRVKKNSNLSKIQSAVYEVAKYSVKHTELTNKSDDDFKEIINQTFRMRFFSTGGILKEMINLQKIEDELVNVDNKIENEWVEIEELLYNWKNGDYYLKSIINIKSDELVSSPTTHEVRR